VVVTIPITEKKVAMEVAVVTGVIEDKEETEVVKVLEGTEEEEAEVVLLKKDSSLEMTTAERITMNSPWKTFQKKERFSTKKAKTITMNKCSLSIMTPRVKIKKESTEMSSKKSNRNTKEIMLEAEAEEIEGTLEEVITTGLELSAEAKKDEAKN
jgi:hypothetical protein